MNRVKKRFNNRYQKNQVKKWTKTEKMQINNSRNYASLRILNNQTKRFKNTKRKCIRERNLYLAVRKGKKETRWQITQRTNKNT